MRQITPERSRESPDAAIANHAGARVTRRLSPHSEQTPYSRTNPPAREMRVAARCPVEGSIPTACPRQRSQKQRPRCASRNVATLSLAIIGLPTPIAFGTGGLARGAVVDADVGPVQAGASTTAAGGCARSGVGVVAPRVDAHDAIGAGVEAGVAAKPTRANSTASGRPT